MRVSAEILERLFPSSASNKKRNSPINTPNAFTLTSVTLIELEESIKTSKVTSPGIDHITY